MAADVPAYQRFIREHGIRPDDVHTVRDLDSIPVMSKANYLSQNPFRNLFCNGSTCSPQVLTSTSGSTGKPTYFARSHAVDDQSALIQDFLRESKRSR